ncbi:NUDIX hydrolase [Azospirillum brasilense]|uniref:NUDIX hydrolase n=1 Tax=Azospirillum brasilense TaxID=192 RepID=UPI00190C0EDF|nr:NUDIX hydrolase [Azospirillum brasilense]MBK3735397.1 NUDIX hydrolase [Azospirillum brasilense]
MNTPVEPLSAAGLILLRDSVDGLEVFMIQRHRDLRFAPGATVFPGGRLDAEDSALPWRELSLPLTDDMPQRMAAIREAFEECGLLMAGGTVDSAVLDGLRNASGGTFLDRLLAAGLEPDVAALVPFARWVTPESVWRRYDTLFFLAKAPPRQTAVVDGVEAVAGFWGTPRAILAEAAAERLSLVFATRMTLLRLADCRTVRHAMEEAARFHPLTAILPRPADTPDGPVLSIPDGLGYPLTQVPLEQARLG